MRIAQKRTWLVFALLCASSLYSGVPGFAADRQLQIAPVRQAPGGEKRLALVIGNSSYKASPLKNPVNDARAIAKALAATGFKVTVLEDASQALMRRAMRTFGDDLQGGGVGLFYYAGHGMQVKGRNYLIPINADIEREDEVEDQAVDANIILAKMDAAKNSLNLMILDACRNNPFARSYRSSAQGLAQMEAPSGTLIAFATSPGSVAADGDGDNGLYTKHLLANLNRPGLPIEQLFKEVRIGVTRDTKDRQVPWESSSLKGNFFFVPGAAVLSADAQRREIEKTISERVAVERAAQQKQMEQMIQQMLAAQRAALEEELKKRGQAAPEAPKPAPVATVAAPAQAFDRSQMELAFWESIKSSTNPEDFKSYLDQYPQGTFAVLARRRATPASIAALKPVEPPKPAPAAAAIQLASAAPTSLLGFGIDDPRYPKIGDLWEYRFVDSYGRNARSVRSEVTAVSKDGIIESTAAEGSPASSRAHAPGPYLRYVGDALQLSPYFLAFGLKEGDSWSSLMVENDRPCAIAGSTCRYDGKVVGREKITTPAGTFDALKVVIDFNWTAISVRAWRQYSYWYSEQTKRIVKTQARTRAGFAPASMGDYDVDLVSYIPAAERTASTQGVQLASAASSGQIGVGIDDPRYPKIGDHWEYGYLDVTTKIRRQTRIEVTSVSKASIGESAEHDGDLRTYGAEPELVSNRMWLEFSPYLLSFAPLKAGETWRLQRTNLPICQRTGANCRFDLKVAGKEKVSTPAGSFEAWRIDVDWNGNLYGIGANNIGGWRQATYWYAESVKRLVKVSMRTRAGINSEPDYDVELLSYKLN